MIVEMRFSILLLALALGGLVASAQTSNSAPSVPPSSAPAIAPAASASDTNQGVDPAKAAEIRKMLELSGTSKIMKQAIDRVIGNFKIKYNTLPATFWAKAEKDINTDDLIDRLVPVYDKYYSIDDLKAVNAFYATPAGQRMLASTPQITRESLLAIQEWAKGTTMEIALDAEKEKVKQGMDASPPTSSPATNAAPLPPPSK